jgi:aldose 1-epimerase
MLVLPKKHRSRPHRAGTVVAIFVMSAPLPASAAAYTAERTTVDGIAVVRLSDPAHRTEVSVVPSVGNVAYEMKVNGQPVLWSPYSTLVDFERKPTFLGVPFLAPWANRLDHDGYFANGKSYLLNPSLKNFRYDPSHHPIHGLLSSSHLWEVTAVGSDDKSAWVTSRLEFWRYPDLMAQFPFAHTIEMTYRLQDGALEVHTAIENHAKEPMPLVIGYHPYFRVAGTKRDTWRLHVAARDHVVLSPALIPTGERRPVDLPDPVPLASTQLDDVFTNLIRDTGGRAEFWVESGSRRVSVLYGPKYPVAVIFAPPGRDFICFEPMTAVTNAMNLAHEGNYPELPSIPPGARWEESFWIRTSGF